MKKINWTSFLKIIWISFRFLCSISLKVKGKWLCRLTGAQKMVNSPTEQEQHSRQGPNHRFHKRYKSHLQLYNLSSYFNKPHTLSRLFPLRLLRSFYLSLCTTLTCYTKKAPSSKKLHLQSHFPAAISKPVGAYQSCQVSIFSIHQRVYPVLVMSYTSSILPNKVMRSVSLHF